MYRCENWTIKKAERQRIYAFELWCWRRFLKVPWTARRSNQPILKQISPEYSLEGLMLKLKLQYSGHLMQTTDSLEKTLMLGKIDGGRRRGWQRMRWLDGITDLMDMSLREGKPGVLQSTGSQRVGHSWATELNWTALNFLLGWSQTRHMPCHLVKDNQDVVQICKQWVCCGCPSTQSWTYRGRERNSVQ